MCFSSLCSSAYHCLLAASREFQVATQPGFEAYENTPGLTVFDLGSSEPVPPVLLQVLQHSSGTNDSQREQVLTLEWWTFAETAMWECRSLVQATLMKLALWSARFHLGVGAIWLSSVVAGMWGAVLFQSIWLNLVNIKYMTSLHSSRTFPKT